MGYAELITYPTEPAHRHVGEVNMIAVREEWQGHGIGRQLMTVILDLADNWLQLRRLGLLVWAGNERAMALYQQMGFALEGTMPEFVYRNGRYVDAHVMGRLAQTRSVTTDSAVLDRELDLLVR